jgi:hypothetical protein
MLPRANGLTEGPAKNDYPDEVMAMLRKIETEGPGVPYATEVIEVSDQEREELYRLLG